MTAPREDDALSWDGDDDPTLEASASPTLPAGFTAVGRGSETVGRADAEPPVVAPAEVADESERPAMGNVELVALGVLGGVYALFTVGWLLGGLRLQGVATYLIADIMFQGSLWLATLAPAIFFVTVVLLTRGRKAWIRISLLVAGAVLLVPWPFAMIGVVGQ